MIKILSGTIIVLSTLALIILGLGIRAGSKIDAELLVRLPYSQDYVYSIFTDIAEYPNRKRNLDNIEVLEMTGSNIVRWRENYSNGSWREYEVIGKRSPVIFDYELYDSSNGHTAEITTTFEQVDEFTEIIMTERGDIQNAFMRGLRFVSGEDSFLRGKSKWLRVSILDEQLSRR